MARYPGMFRGGGVCVGVWVCGWVWVWEGAFVRMCVCVFGNHEFYILKSIAFNQPSSIICINSNWSPLRR